MMNRFAFVTALTFSLAIIILAIAIPIIIHLSIKEQNYCNPQPIFGFVCISNKCIRILLTNKTKTTAVSFVRCRQSCQLGLPADFWPKPYNGTIEIKSNSPRQWVSIYTHLIYFNRGNYSYDLDDFFNNIEHRFMKQLRTYLPKGCVELYTKDEQPLQIEYYIEYPELLKLTRYTDESYKILHDDKSNVIIISGSSIFGIRHGLETLVQIIVYDDLVNKLLFRNGIYIKDTPKYPHRGITLDTASNYISVKSIKQTIEGMAMVKLNVFHWRITNSYSFPLAIKSHENLWMNGAYSDKQVYTAEDVKDIVRYAYYRGVRVIPEIDMPASVGEGWQTTGFGFCFDQAYLDNCTSPLCVHLDPTNEKLYVFLKDIFEELVEMFDYPDMIHLGHSQINHECWNRTPVIVAWMKENGFNRFKMETFLDMWLYFLNNTIDIYKSISPHTSFIIWSNDLYTYQPFVNTHKYTITIQANTDAYTTTYLENKFSVIMSTNNYFDLACGWERRNCSIYKGWASIYRYSYATNIFSKYAEQIVGGEAILTTEQVDDRTLSRRLWPRCAALAEIYWSITPKMTNYLDAQPRMIMQRERYKMLGLQPETFTTEWCKYNDTDCH